MIEVGQHVFGSVQVGQSIAFTAFALCLIVAAVECRSETGTVLTTSTFDSKQMNWAMLGEFVLAVLVTQMDVFNRLLGTTQLNPAPVRLGPYPGPRPPAALGTRQVHSAASPAPDLATRIRPSRAAALDPGSASSSRCDAGRAAAVLDCDIGCGTWSQRERI